MNLFGFTLGDTAIAAFVGAVVSAVIVGSLGALSTVFGRKVVPTSEHRRNTAQADEARTQQLTEMLEAALEHGDRWQARAERFEARAEQLEQKLDQLSARLDALEVMPCYPSGECPHLTLKPV